MMPLIQAWITLKYTQHGGIYFVAKNISLTIQFVNLHAYTQMHAHLCRDTLMRTLADRLHSFFFRLLGCVHKTHPPTPL